MNSLSALAIITATKLIAHDTTALAYGHEIAYYKIHEHIATAVIDSVNRTASNQHSHDVGSTATYTGPKYRD